MTDTFDNRLDELGRALKVIETIKDNPELQNSAFAYMFGTAGFRTPAPGSSPSASDSGDTESRANGGSKRGTGTKRAGKVAAVAQDKTLEIAPKGKQSWAEFQTAKAPGNLNEKYTTAVYWLLEVAELSTATLNQVYSLFLAAKWAVPANPRNKLHMAGSVGYLDTADANAIKLTSHGTALVMNDLPHDKKS